MQKFRSAYWNRTIYIYLVLSAKRGGFLPDNAPFTRDMAARADSKPFWSIMFSAVCAGSARPFNTTYTLSTASICPSRKGQQEWWCISDDVSRHLLVLHLHVYIALFEPSGVPTGGAEGASRLGRHSQKGAKFGRMKKKKRKTWKEDQERENERDNNNYYFLP